MIAIAVLLHHHSRARRFLISLYLTRSTWRRSRTYRHRCMMTPKIGRHRGGGQEITDKHRWPSQRVKKRLGEKECGADKAEFEDDKEKQNSETCVDVLLRQLEQLGAQPADRAEQHAMNPGVDQHHLERNGQCLWSVETGAMTEKRGAKNVGRVKGTAADEVDDKEPNRDRHCA